MLDLEVSLDLMLMLNLNVPFVLEVPLVLDVQVTLAPDLTLALVIAAAAGGVITESDTAIAEDRFLCSMQTISLLCLFLYENKYNKLIVVKPMRHGNHDLIGEH